MDALKNELIEYIETNIKELKENDAIDKDIKLENLASMQIFQIKGLLNQKSIPQKLKESIEEYENTAVQEIQLESLPSGSDNDFQISSLLDSFIDLCNDNTITIVSNLSEFINCASSNSNNTFLYRGMDNSNYKMMPSAFREGYTEKEFLEDMVEFEKMIEYFDKTILSKSELEKHAYAQHYMFNTNLMDFTYAPLIALLFALENYTSDKDAIIYRIDVDKYNEVIMHNRETGCTKITEESISQLNSLTMPTFIYSNDLNHRIHTQKGVFLYFPFTSANTIEQKEDLHNKFLTHCLKEDVLKVYLIKNEDRNKILKSLFDMGINFENIYPELDAAAKGTKFLSYFRKNGGE